MRGNTTLHLHCPLHTVKAAFSIISTVYIITLSVMYDSDFVVLKISANLMLSDFTLNGRLTTCERKMINDGKATPTAAFRGKYVLLLLSSNGQILSINFLEVL
jgi:hypothetical protein